MKRKSSPPVPEGLSSSRQSTDNRISQSRLLPGCRGSDRHKLGVVFEAGDHVRCPDHGPNGMKLPIGHQAESGRPLVDVRTVVAAADAGRWLVDQSLRVAPGHIPGTLLPEAIPFFPPPGAALDDREWSASIANVNSDMGLSEARKRESIKGCAAAEDLEAGSATQLSPATQSGDARRRPGNGRMERAPGPSKPPSLAGATEPGSGKDGQQSPATKRPCQPAGAEHGQRAWRPPAPTDRPADSTSARARAFKKASRQRWQAGRWVGSSSAGPSRRTCSARAGR